MPSATTRHSLPIPLETDPLADIALAVQQLAGVLDHLLPHKLTENIAVVSADTFKQKTVNLPRTFATPPMVIPTVRGTSVWIPYVSSVTTTQVTLGIRKYDGTPIGSAVSVPVDYIVLATS